MPNKTAQSLLYRLQQESQGTAVTMVLPSSAFPPAPHSRSQVQKGGKFKGNQSGAKREKEKEEREGTEELGIRTCIGEG